MIPPDREQIIQAATNDYMDDLRRMRNCWLRKLAQERRLTEREYIRMVQAADIQAKSRGHLDEYRGQIEEGYRDWFESSIDNL